LYRNHSFIVCGKGKKIEAIPREECSFANDLRQ